jgi:zinc D-Ala-D-Ala carboxypeptidase
LLFRYLDDYFCKTYYIAGIFGYLLFLFQTMNVFFVILTYLLVLPAVLFSQDCSKAWMHHDLRTQLSTQTMKEFDIQVPVQKIQIDFLGAPVGIPFNYSINNYCPFSDVVIVDEIKNLLLHKLAFQNLQKMRRASGFSFHINFCYRSYSEQKALFDKLGPELAEKPGYSEHHLYTAVDIRGLSSHQFLWLLQNAFDFGWVPSYYFRMGSQVKKETWHWRYVGKLAALKFRCAWEAEINKKILKLKSSK